MKLQEAMEMYEGLSLRKLAEASGCNYNMLLKAAKQPIAGVPYDPAATNYEAIEAYIGKKVPDGLNYDDIAIMDINANVKLPFTPEVGQRINIRGDEGTFEICMVTDTHVVIMLIGGTQPRVFSNSTFMHQTPRKVG